MKLIIAASLFLAFSCAAATPLSDLAEDMVSVPRSEVTRVNEVINDMNKANEVLLKELIDLRREREFLRAKLGCA